MLAGRRDRSDRALGTQLDGLMGFVMEGGKRPMTAIRYGVLRHLERVRHQLSFETTEEAAVARWAQAANALVFHAEDRTLRAPDGKVLVDPITGDPEPGAALPYPADAVARQRAISQRLEEHGIHVPAHLPPCVSEAEVELREPRDVATRVLALFICAARAEALVANEPRQVAMMQERMPRGFAALSPRELAFMHASAPPQQDVIDHLCRYEAIVPLAWSLGIVDSLPFPRAICDVPALAATLFELDAEAFVGSARLRPVGELLDALDLTFRLHWAVTDARIQQRAPEGVEPGAVSERHHALNWLTRFVEAAWDDVPTPT